MEDWRDQAACRGLDPNIFVIERGVPSRPAKAVCAQCDVTAECDQFAIDNNLQGVWGGRVHRSQKAAKDKRVEQVVVLSDVTDARPRKS